MDMMGKKKKRKTETLKCPVGDKGVEAAAGPIPDESGGLIGAVHAMSDITPQKQAEEAYIQSEERYKRLIKAINAYTYSVKIKEGRPVSTRHSAACLSITGYRPEDYESEPLLWHRMIHPEDRTLVENWLKEILAGREAPPIEHRLIRRDGKVIWVRNTIVPYCDGENKLIFYDGLIEDITRRKQVENEFRESEEKYKTLTESSLTGVFIHQDERFVFVNEKYAEIHGYKPGELIGEDPLKLIHPDERAALKERVLKRLKGEAVPQRYEIRRVRKDGKTIWCETMATLIQYKGRTAVMGNVIDITDRKQAEEKMKKAHADILIRQDAIVKLSEELRQEIEERKKAEREIKQYYAQVRNLVSQMALIEENERRRIANVLHDSIGQNLALSRIMLDELQVPDLSGPLSLSLDELTKIIDEAIHSTRDLTFEISSPILYELGVEAAIEWLGEKLLKRRNILFDFRNDRKPKTLSKEAQVLLFQAVREFYLNIIKHAKAHHVSVIVKELDSNIHISIEDDGVGFDTKTLHSQTSKLMTYGLFSIRERISLIEGNFEIESIPGQGTRVTLIAPLAV
jgi:PAS domain S-box-containing protein